MHHHCQHFSSIFQLDLSSIAVRCSFYEIQIDFWKIKNRKRAEFDHNYIFRKFWKYWVLHLLVYSYLWSFSTSLYRLGLHPLISNLMEILVLRYTGWCFCKKILQNGSEFCFKILVVISDSWETFSVSRVFAFLKHYRKLRD